MVKPLPENTLLEAGGRVFIIKKYHARGGTAFLYSAEEENLPGMLMIKEACPHNDTGLLRDGLVIRSNNSAAECRLHNCRKALLREFETGQEISNIAARAKAFRQIIVDRMEYEAENLEAIRETDDQHGPGGSVFLVAQDTQLQGTFLSELLEEKKQFTVRETILLERHILESLAVIHRNGYLHGDAALGNFMMGTPDNPTEEDPFGEVYPLDFGCSRKTSITGEGMEPETKPIPVAEVFSSPEYAAPEYRRRTGGTLKLTQKVDVYAVGAMALQFLGLLPETDDELEKSVSTMRLSTLRRRGATDAVARDFKAYLTKCVSSDVQERYSLEQALEHINKLCKATKPLDCLLRYPNLGMETGLYETVLKNRQFWLRWLDEELERDGPSFLWGLGGIGKTSLALTYAKSRYPDRAFRITYQGDLRKAIAELNFSGFDETGLDAEQRYQKKLDLLREQYPSKDFLMILDNFDSSGKTLFDLKDRTFNEVTELPMRILITTRSDPGTAQPTRKLSAPSKDAMVAYFQQVVGREMEGTELFQVREFVRLVQRHPMTVEIAAKCVRATFRSVSVAELVEAFRKNLKEARMPGVRMEKHGASGKQTPYEHLKILFDLTNLTEAERTVLCHAALLPEDGMDQELFFRCEGEAEQDALEFLTERSMLQCSEDRRLRIHPLVREVVCGELSPSEDNCWVFLSKMRSDALSVGLRQLYEIERFQISAGRRFSKECEYNHYNRYLMLEAAERLFPSSGALRQMMYEFADSEQFRMERRIPGLNYIDTAILNGGQYEVWAGILIPTIGRYAFCVHSKNLSDVLYARWEGQNSFTVVSDPKERFAAEAFMCFNQVRLMSQFVRSFEPRMLEDALIEGILAVEAIRSSAAAHDCFLDIKSWGLFEPSYRFYQILVRHYESAEDFGASSLYVYDWMGGNHFDSVAAEIYEMVAKINEDLGNHRRALSFLWKAEACFPLRDPYSHRRLADIYRKLSTVYGKMGMSENQQDCLRSAEEYDHMR